jgi:hypothetical protein
VGNKIKPGVAAALTVGALALAGCSNTEMFSSQGAEQWFSKPFTGFSKQEWAVTSNPTNPNAVRPVTPEDFVDASGRCAAPAPAADANAAPAAGDGNATAPTVTGGVALMMTECEVVARAGAPSQVELGADAGGERTTVLTFRQGPWPGIYRFQGGRLAEVEGVAAPEKPKAQPRKKQPARSKTAAQQQ